jgi:hypothetical protein
MSQPYHALHTGTFNYRYFNVDSVMHFSSLRRRLEQDSARLVFFGVIPKLGKRGVIWEVFSAEGPSYFSLGGPSLILDQIVRDINTVQEKGGNFLADSIRAGEISAEIDRLKNLTDEEKKELRLYQQAYDLRMEALKDERMEIIRRFPNLGRIFPLEE